MLSFPVIEMDRSALPQLATLRKKENYLMKSVSERITHTPWQTRVEFVEDVQLYCAAVPEAGTESEQHRIQPSQQRDQLPRGEKVSINLKLFVTIFYQQYLVFQESTVKS